MVTVALSPAQAGYVANLVTAAQRAQQAANEAVALLTLGHVPAGAILSDINTDTGVLTFTEVLDGDA